MWTFLIRHSLIDLRSRALRIISVNFNGVLDYCRYEDIIEPKLKDVLADLNRWVQGNTK